ncbi:MAG: hypothetical protein M1831_006529 [Alyxoria varia]|nr:MAG: hypothetical protein M1831_006529 [Alyxoria varia]
MPPQSTASNTSIAAQLQNQLSNRHLPPKSTWLNDFLAGQKPTIPIPSLEATATYRLLASDITKSLQPPSATSVFPDDILNAQLKERPLAGPITVQVLDVEDVGRSRWSQIEALEAAERGETTKGREIVRVVPGEDGISDPTGVTQGASISSSGPHKVLMQDANGRKGYGFEMSSVKEISTGMSIGMKMVLRGAVVARGVVLLTPGCVTMLGGKIESLQKAWKEGRKAALKAAIDSTGETK